MFFIAKSNKLNSHQKFVSFLFVLMPILLITGPFLSDLALSIVAIYYFFNTKKIKFPNKNKFSFLFFLFYFAVLLNSFNFDYYLFSLKSFFFYFRFFLFILVIVYMIELEEKIIDDFLKIILLSITIVCFFGFYQYAEIRLDYFERMSKVDRMDELIRVKNTTQQRVSGIFGNELIMGSYLMKIFPLFLITFFFRKKEDILSKSNYVYLFLITILIAISIVITSDRAPILLFCFQIFLFFLLIKKLRKFFFILGTIVFFSFCTIILIDPISKERVVNVTVNNIKGEYTGGNITVISEAYEGHFNAAKIIFKKYPILGSGIKGFRNQCYNLNKENYKEKIWCTTHPHNIFFQIISETGILGLFIYLILFYYVLNQIYQKIKKQIKFEKENILITNLICLINFVVILWPLTTSGSMFNNYNTIFFCLPVILYLASNNKIISKD